MDALTESQTVAFQRVRLEDMEVEELTVFGCPTVTGAASGVGVDVLCGRDDDQPQQHAPPGHVKRQEERRRD
eukprot:3913096-Rhodomonas_salina.2